MSSPPLHERKAPYWRLSGDGSGYQHLILAVEVKNFAKVKLLSFNVTAVFPHCVMMSENDVLEAGSTVDVFAWLTQSSDCEFELQVE